MTPGRDEYLLLIGRREMGRMTQLGYAGSNSAQLLAIATDRGNGGRVGNAAAEGNQAKPVARFACR